MTALQTRGGRTALRVREYSPADRPACLSVFDTNVPRYFVSGERAEFAAFLDDLPGPYFVVESDDGVLACGGYAYNPGTTTADLCWDMVRGDRHGTGVGSRLLEERLARLRTDPAVLAVALSTSQHARGFYERAGFVTERVVPDGHAPGLDRCEMRLDLARGPR